MGFISNVIAILTFSSEEIALLADDTGATIHAILITFLASFISFLPNFVHFMAIDDPTSQNFALTAALTNSFTIFLILIVFSGIMPFVLRNFGVTVTVIQCLRVFGFTQIWSIVGSIIDLFIALASFDYGISFGQTLRLIALLGFTFGLARISGLFILPAIIAVIVTYIISYTIALIIASAIVSVIIIISYMDTLLIQPNNSATYLLRS